MTWSSASHQRSSAGLVSKRPRHSLAASSTAVKMALSKANWSSSSSGAVPTAPGRAASAARCRSRMSEARRAIASPRVSASSRCCVPEASSISIPLRRGSPGGRRAAAGRARRDAEPPIAIPRRNTIMPRGSDILTDGDTRSQDLSARRAARRAVPAPLPEALPGAGARGGPDRVPVVELDPVTPAEGGGEVLFRGGDAEPVRVGDGLHAAGGEHWRERGAGRGAADSVSAGSSGSGRSVTVRAAQQARPRQLPLPDVRAARQVGEQRLHGLRRVGLVGADHAGRAALQPAGDVLPGERLAGLGAGRGRWRSGPCRSARRTGRRAAGRTGSPRCAGPSARRASRTRPCPRTPRSRTGGCVRGEDPQPFGMMIPGFPPGAARSGAAACVPARPGRRHAAPSQPAMATRLPRTRRSDVASAADSPERSKPSSRSSSAGSADTCTPPSSPSSRSSLVVNLACAGPRRPMTCTSRTLDARSASMTGSGMSVCSRSAGSRARMRATSTATLPTPMTATDSASRANAPGSTSG